MKLPKSVTILGRKFKVEVADRDKISKITGTNRPDGALSYMKKIIMVAEDLDEDETLVTFLHECNHAIDYISGFSQILTSNEFELLAETRGNGFADVFKALKKGL
jgi:orotidine-5'-phosphate decarboxylase